jgi:hypothetical protein
MEAFAVENDDDPAVRGQAVEFRGGVDRVKVYDTEVIRGKAPGEATKRWGPVITPLAPARSGAGSAVADEAQAASASRKGLVAEEMHGGAGGAESFGHGGERPARDLGIDPVLGGETEMGRVVGEAVVDIAGHGQQVLGCSMQVGGDGQAGIKAARGAIKA